MSKEIKSVTIRAIEWRTQPTKHGQVRCWEIFTDYFDGTCSVLGEFKTYQEALDSLGGTK
jgi:hypothetical protein